MEQIGDTPLKQIMVWDASKLDDLEFVGEVADSMGDFSHANKWSIDNLKNIISQQQDKIKSFENDLQQQKSLVEANYQNQINAIKQQHQDQLQNLENHFKQENKKFQETSTKEITEKDKQINNLSSQVKDLQGKQLAWEIIKEEALTSNEQLKLSQEDLYHKLSHVQKFNKIPR
jgi:hypothetical protein